MKIIFQEWDDLKDESNNFLKVTVSGDPENCTLEFEGEGNPMFKENLIKGVDFYSTIKLEDPESKGHFNPKKLSHWKLLPIIFNNAYFSARMEDE